MLWLKFTADGQTSWGVVEGDRVIAASGDPFGEWQRTPRSHSLADVKIELPVMPRTFYCVGLNYLKHLKEAADKRGEVPNVPDRPEIGYRAQNALIAHDEDVVIPATATEKIHYEGELVVVIGKKAKHLSEADAMSCVFGYTIGNDVSERSWQKADRGLWRAKNADTFKPMGPWIETDVDLGVDYIFANLGTDHVSLIEELARWDKEGRKHPEMILCPHEVVAVHMAGGYALATGRGQAVFVHVDAGTANACMAIQNLFRYRLPVMLFAGRAPYTLHGELRGSRDTYVHFVQDPFDIASIVRPYVKWEYSLPSGIVVKEALARASAFAQSDPPGPVYMMLPRETLAEQWDDVDMPAYPPARYGGVHTGGIEPARVDAIVQALMSAKNPVAFA